MDKFSTRISWSTGSWRVAEKGRGERPTLEGRAKRRGIAKEDWLMERERKTTLLFFWGGGLLLFLFFSHFLNNPSLGNFNSLPHYWNKWANSLLCQEEREATPHGNICLKNTSRQIEIKWAWTALHLFHMPSNKVSVLFWGKINVKHHKEQWLHAYRTV